jgi:hypothetical protein
MRRAPTSDHENQNSTHVGRRTEAPDCKSGLTDSTLKNQIEPEVAAIRSQSKERNSTHRTQKRFFLLRTNNITTDSWKSPTSLPYLTEN